MVDRINSSRRKKDLLLNLFRLQTFQKVREQGLINTFKKGVKLLKEIVEAHHRRRFT